uniref:Uncharacterized protein n=1 Tax=Rhizophora mucronata TaxID=61149 RepID=A0A2P2N567_RHIMU
MLSDSLQEPCNFVSLQKLTFPFCFFWFFF